MVRKNNNNNKNTEVVFQPIKDREPPKSETSAVHWMRVNLFSSPISVLMTGVAVAIIIAVVPGVFNWLFFDATWTGDQQSDCDRLGACWIFIEEKFFNFVYGFVPSNQYWRFNVVFMTFPLLWIPFFIQKIKARKRLIYGIILFSVYPIIGYFLILGLSDTQCSLNTFEFFCRIPTFKWGGLSLTIILSYVGIIASIPFGVLLALGRMSRLPVVRVLCVAFIEAWRGVPLITILFTASVVFPIFLPSGVEFDKLIRALIGIILFESAYMAEVIRGGLQSVDTGQHEAADALGLSYWQKINNIILPQAIRVVIPSIVGTSISLAKDTTLVTIIGLLDVLAVVTAASADSNWLGFETEGYILVAFFFWVLCFSMSRYSFSLEKKFSTEHKT